MFGTAGVTVFIKASAAGEEDARKRSLRFLYGSLAVVTIIDLLGAVVLFVLSCDGQSVGTCFVHQLGDETEGYSLKHGTVICVLLAISRPVVFSGLVLFVQKKGRQSGNVHRRRVNGAFSEALQVGLVSGSREGGGGRRNALWWSRIFKYSTLTVIFIFSCAQQVYFGVKVSQYEWHKAKSFQVVLMCLTVLWINLETYFTRSLAEEVTREDGKFLENVHRHPLFFDPLTTYWHECDLCNKSIKSGGCWRCALCDFDCCKECMARDDVDVVSENRLRTDKGVVKETTVSGLTLFWRAIEIAKPHRALISAALFVLLLMCLTSLAMPRFQGAIIDQLVPGEDGTLKKDEFLRCIQVYFGIMMLQVGVDHTKKLDVPTHFVGQSKLKVRVVGRARGIPQNGIRSCGNKAHCDSSKYFVRALGLSGCGVLRRNYLRTSDFAAHV